MMVICFILSLVILHSIKQDVCFPVMFVSIVYLRNCYEYFSIIKRYHCLLVVQALEVWEGLN